MSLDNLCGPGKVPHRSDKLGAQKLVHV